MSAMPVEGTGTTAVLAIFDLDGTLVVGDTFVPFQVTYALRRRGVRALPPLLLLPIELGLYASRFRTAATAKERLLRAFFGCEHKVAIAEHAAWYFENWVRRKLRPEIVWVLRIHREAGRRVILLSDSPDLYVRQVARGLGLPR